MSGSIRCGSLKARFRISYVTDTDCIVVFCFDLQLELMKQGGFERDAIWTSSVYVSCARVEHLPRRSENSAAWNNGPLMPDRNGAFHLSARFFLPFE
jgi:hypothetical protein